MRGILSKLWISITAMVMVILLVIWWFNIFLLDKFYLDQKIKSLYEKGESLAQVIKPSDMEKINRPLLKSIDSERGRKNPPGPLLPDPADTVHKKDFIYYFDMKNSDALYENDVLWPGQPPFIDQNIGAISKNIQNGERFSQKLSIGQGSRSFHAILVGVPLEQDGQTSGYLLLMSLSRNIDSTTAILKKQFTIIALISIGVAFAFSFMLAKYFTKPILLIKSVSDSISKGRYGMQVSVKNNDEIGLLSNSINRMSRELSKIEQLRRDFIANVTHEFKTPLSVIKTYSEMIKDIDMGDWQSVEYDANVVLSETERLSSMVSDMLYLSSMQSENSSLNLEKIDICEVLRDIIDKTINMAHASGVTLVKDCPSPLLIQADREKITRCLANFIVNSISHTPSGKSVFIYAQKTGEGLAKIGVRDEGCGISEKDLPHIWERFYKADMSRRSGPQGTGLGMSIARDILEMHGFKYGISSEKGEGTNVWFIAGSS